MSLNNQSPRQRLGRWSQDDAVYRAVRTGALFILFLALTLGIFFALWLWNSPPEGTASDLQRAFYTVGGGAVIAALITWALSAVQDTPAEERPRWFCPLMAGGLGLALYLLAYAFLGAYPFGGKTVLMVDLHHQYAPLLSELRHMILEGGDFTYNFNVGMGAAFIPTFAYYLASPLNLLLLFFSESALPDGIFVITLLKGALAAAAFTAMAQYLYKNRTMSMVAVGLLYALCGFMLAYSWNIMWLDVLVLLPVVVMAMEYMLTTGRIIPYAATLGLALFCNYYIGFMLCVFLVLYMGVWLLRQRRTLKEVGIGCARFAVGSLWGAGMAACILIPTALALGRTSAAGGEMVEFDTNFTLVDLLGRLFYGAELTIRSGNLPNIYCGVPAVLLAPVYLTSKEIPLRRRLCYAALLAVMMVSCTLSQIDLLWHGLHAPNDLPYRFSFLLSFVLLMMAAAALCHIKSVTPKQILGSLAGCAGFLMLWEKMGALTAATDAELAEKTTIEPRLLYVNLILLAGYAFLLVAAAVWKHRTVVFNRLLLTLVCVELLLGAPYTLTQMNENEHFTGRIYYTAHVKHQVLDDALRRAEELAQEEGGTFSVFCRYEYLPRTTCVDTALHHYSGLTTFASSNPYLTTKFMGEMGYAINGVNSYLYHSYVAPTDSLLGLRYVILDVKITTHPQLTLLDSVSAVNGEEVVTYYIYRNELALPVGMAVSEDIRDYEGTKYDPFESQQSLFTSLTGIDTPLYEAMELTSIADGGTVSDSGVSFGENGGVFEAVADTAGRYFAYVDCRAAEDISVEHYRPNEADEDYINGWTVTNHEPYIIDMGTLQVGDRVEVALSGDTAATGNVYLMRIDHQALDEYITTLGVGGMKLTDRQGSSLTGTVTAAKDQVLFFSIPYDEGWQVYVDGVPTETFPIDNDEETTWDDDGNAITEGGDDGALLGAEIAEGTHTVTLVFKPKGQLVGAVISAISLMLLAVPAMLEWRRKKKAAAPVRLADLAETSDEEAPILLPDEGEDTPAEPTTLIPLEDIEEILAEDSE